MNRVPKTYERRQRNKNSDCALLIGPSNSGKSTLAAKLTGTWLENANWSGTSTTEILAGETADGQALIIDSAGMDEGELYIILQLCLNIMELRTFI